jgi:putative Ca2+/H+ antiporter (TMEM165/GDT1 family)
MLYWYIYCSISCQIATIGLAADENPFGVVIGGVM